MDLSSDTYDNQQLLLYIKSLEQRVTRIESQLEIENQVDEEKLKLPHLFKSNSSDDSDDLEDEIGQFWLAKAGIVVLAIGLMFILTFPFKSLPPVLPGVLGYVIVFFLLIISRLLKSSYDLLSRYLFGASMLLTYFSTLRLHYFSPEPALENIEVFSILLFVVCVINLVIAIRRESIYLITIEILFTALTSLVNNNPILVYVTLTLLSGLLVYLKAKRGWSQLFNVGSIIILLIHFWFSIGNYFIADSTAVISYTVFNPVFLLFYCILLLSANLFSKENFVDDAKTIFGTVLTSGVPFLMLLGLSISKYKESLIPIHLAVSIIFLIAAIVYWTKYESKYSTFLYAIFGYASLSVAIVGYFPKPDSFVWLSWQSVLVVSTAIWFRSKFIVVANFGIYLLVYFAYLILSGSVGVISLSFGFVALLSARILNWKKDRLELKTEMMRIAYLVAAFFIFPYALYHIVPENYVSLSWMVVALFYFVLGIVLKNIKYRWMSLATLFLTVLYVVTIGSSNFDPSFRILSFILLGVALIITSIFYTKRKRLHTAKPTE